ncbi:MAG: hypothetical protein IK008_00635 [Bacteroidales bacterium]|nr:hypothetical protein [Bacteroidales bacterium]
MRKLSVIVSALLLLAACSPQVYPLYLDVRKPSASGLDLSRKSMSLVYMDGYNKVDSLFDRHTASALARSLEEDYFGGEPVIGLFHIPSADSVSLEKMHTLVMETEGDVIFVLSSHLNMPADTTGAMIVPLKTHLSVYDSMGEDKVFGYDGNTLLEMEGMKSLGGQADEIGGRIAKRFLSDWKTESFSFYYFDGFSDDWTDALSLAGQGKMGKAMDIWMEQVKKGSIIKKACAAYNMAMGFYLLEDTHMSAYWLEYADKLEELSLSAGLHQRLEQK